MANPKQALRNAVNKAIANGAPVYGNMPAKTPGQLAYEADVAARPHYDGGYDRRQWDQLCDVAKWSWERNPTARFDRPALDHA